MVNGSQTVIVIGRHIDSIRNQTLFFVSAEIQIKISEETTNWPGKKNVNRYFDLSNKNKTF